MKTKVLAVVAAAALALAPVAGCAPMMQGSPFAETLVDDKALYSAEAAYFGALTLADTAVDSGLLVAGSPRAVQVADGLQKAYDALLAARAAYDAGNVVLGQAKAAMALAEVAGVQRLIKPRPG